MVIRTTSRFRSCGTIELKGLIGSIGTYINGNWFNPVDPYKPQSPLAGLLIKSVERGTQAGLPADCLLVQLLASPVLEVSNYAKTRGNHPAL